jgi:hypothetical protein
MNQEKQIQESEGPFGGAAPGKCQNRLHALKWCLDLTLLTQPSKKIN